MIKNIISLSLLVMIVLIIGCGKADPYPEIIDNGKFITIGNANYSKEHIITTSIRKGDRWYYFEISNPNYATINNWYRFKGSKEDCLEIQKTITDILNKE